MKLSHIARSTLLVALFFTLDKGLGLVRQIFFNRQFQLTYELDVFNAANNIPDLLSSLISGGALGMALIPVLSEQLQRHGRDQAWKLFSHVVNLAFLVTGALALLTALLAEPLVHYVVAPGFPVEQRALSVELMRLNLVAIMIFSISGLVMAGLQTNQHFLLPALAPSLYNAGQIFGALVLASDSGLGLGIHGLVYGVILGAALHLGIQLPGLWRYGFRWSAGLELRSSGMPQVLRLMAPRVATMFFLQVSYIVRDNVASGVGEGAVSALSLGWFIMQVPETLIGSALAIVLLPTLAEHFNAGRDGRFGETANQALRVLLALTLPVAAVMAGGIRPLVQAVFGYDARQTEMVMAATNMYLLGLSGHALLEVAVRSFYARQQPRLPLLYAGINAAMHIGFSWGLAALMGHAGIALANTLAFTFNALALLWLLSRNLPGLLALRPTLLRAGAAALLGGGAAALLSGEIGAGLWRWADAGMLTQLMVGGAAVSLGGALALPFIWPELRLLLRLGERGAAKPNQSMNAEE